MLYKRLIFYRAQERRNEMISILFTMWNSGLQEGAFEMMPVDLGCCGEVGARNNKPFIDLWG